MTELSPKDPRETITVSFDFAALTPAPLTPTVTITRLSGSGTDDSASLPVGGCTLAGTVVSQKLTAGSTGSRYKLEASVYDAAGNHWIEAATLRVVTTGT